MAKVFPNEKIHNYIFSELDSNNGLELVNSQSKEAIVFDERETSWIFTFEKADSPIKVLLTISDPLYFCDVSFYQNETEHFTLNSYLKNTAQSIELEKVLDSFMDDNISEEEYTMSFLNIFKKYLGSCEVQEIISATYWPDVPSE
jgi:hypothetical protein